MPNMNNQKTSPEWKPNWLQDSISKIQGIVADAVKGKPQPLPPEPVKINEAPKEPLWLFYARQEIGQKEVAGKNHNQRIVSYWKTSKVPAKINDDETPWCAAFVNAMLEMSDVDGTMSGLAVSFARSNNFIKIDKPVLGCIVVYWRKTPKSGLGHVQFATSHNNTHIWGISGNQGDAVTEASFPKSRLIGYYWPKNVPFINIALPVRGAGGSNTTKDD